MIRYVVNTNHHMAYAGGLRTYFLSREPQS